MVGGEDHFLGEYGDPISGRVALGEPDALP